MMPSLEKMRFVSSGTEATMSALRAARGFTGRHRIIKIDGGYHGHADTLLAKAGSGVVDAGPAGLERRHRRPPSPTRWSSPSTISTPCAAAFEEHRDEIAALIVEPIPANMGVVLPRPAYLPLLRSLCDEHGALLIFDEVITGFRVARGGAQRLFGVRPDLTCLGKIVGGGLPFGVYGGRADVMDVVAPVGPVYQAGTLSGNPLAVAAGLATLQARRTRLRALEGIGRVLEDDLARAIAAQASPPACSGSARPSRSSSHREVVDLAAAKKADTEVYAKFFHGMLERGFLLPPAQFEAAFISLAHTDEEIDSFVAAAHETLAALAVLR